MRDISKNIDASPTLLQANCSHNAMLTQSQLTAVCIYNETSRLVRKQKETQP